MDRKSILVLLVSFLLLTLWFPLVNRLFPPVQLPQRTNTVTISTSPVDTNNPVVSTQAAALIPPQATNLQTHQMVHPTAPEETLTLTNENTRYTFSSHGGGLKLVELTQYPATIACGVQEKAKSTPLASLNTLARVPALAILGEAAVQGDGIFMLTQTATGVRAEKALSNDLYLVKDFQLSTNYLLKTTVRFENRSAQPIRVPPHEWVLGTATPMGQKDESITLGAQWYDGKKAEDVFVGPGFGCFPGRARTEHTVGSSNVFWVSAHNQFFALVGVPNQPAPGMAGRRVDLPPPTKAQLEADSKIMAQPFGYLVSFLYPETVLGPNQSMERRMDLYAGPKEYYTLSRLGNNLDLVMRFGAFGFFAKGLLLSMNGLHRLDFSYGVAIIVITIVIKLLFWPLTNASTKSMKRMAALQPQMKALQEKYKEDPKKMNMKLMEFMKENRVSPLGGCLPMLLQIPVFIGFYQMLQSAIELRGAPFLWACDLSQPDTVYTIPGLGFIPFFGIPGQGLPINPLPLFMGATMIWQARLTPPSPGMDPVQQRIMKYMPLMFMVFLYNFSAGLTLYWTVQNLLTIAQMKLTKASDPKTQSGTKPSSPASPAPKKRNSP